ncbi:hypothetical protein Tco_1274122 [Tanacetum coccineum]
MVTTNKERKRKKKADSRRRRTERKEEEENFWLRFLSTKGKKEHRDDITFATKPSIAMMIQVVIGGTNPAGNLVHIKPTKSINTKDQEQEEIKEQED